MDGIIQFIQDRLVIVIIIASLLAIFIYAIYAVFLNKLNNSLYGKSTWMAWIPIFNNYLLGKLAYHWIIGILFVILLFLSVGANINLNGVEKYYSILPRNIQEPLAIVYSSITVITIIYAYIKYKKIVRSGFAKGEFDSFSSVNYENLNRPFLGKENIISEQNKTLNNQQEEKKTEQKENDFYNVTNTPNNNSSEHKISLTSLNHHNDETESYEKIFNENNPKN